MNLILAFLVAIAIIYAYRLGINDGKNLSKGQALPMPTFNSETDEQTDNEFIAVLQNIDSYDGTENGQIRL